MSRLAVSLVLLAGCSTAAALDDLGATDAGADAAAVADLAPRSYVGVACGALSCFSMAQLCCTADQGKTGTCDPIPLMTCGQSEFFCDGPEDCAPADPLCCVSNGVAQCQSKGACAAGTVLCHAASDCAPAEHCCPAPNGSPYALCLSRACP